MYLYMKSVLQQIIFISLHKSPQTSQLCLLKWVISALPPSLSSRHYQIYVSLTIRAPIAPGRASCTERAVEGLDPGGKKSNQYLQAGANKSSVVCSSLSNVRGPGAGSHS